MNRIFIGIVCAGMLLGGTEIGRAQDRPEKVPGFAELQHPHEWYVAQERLWKNEVERAPLNEEAWLNYFKAARYTGFGDTTRDISEKDEHMRKVLDEMGRAIPNTFTYHYTQWWNGGNDERFFPELEKAYAIRPDYAQLSDDFMTYYEMMGNDERTHFFARKWYETKAMAPGLLEYNYNVLMSLEKNAILVTSGDNDTYPIWLLQYAKGIRPDVTVLNSSLVADSSYRTLAMKKYHVEGDATKLDNDRVSRTSYEACTAEFMKSLAESNHQRPVYFALTCDLQSLTLIKENLYTVGLANRYSAGRIDNVAMLKKNWERFRLDYLDLDFYGEDYPFTQGLLPQLNMNYVMPALLLYEHYRIAGEDERGGKFREFALAIAKQGEQRAEVEEYVARIDRGEGIEEPAIEEKSADVKHDDGDLGRDVKIVPNPANDAITIEMPEAIDADVQLVDMQGKVLQTMKSSGREIRMSTDGARPGTYVVHIRTAKGHFSKTVQIIR